MFFNFCIAYVLKIDTPKKINFCLNWSLTTKVLYATRRVSEFQSWSREARLESESAGFLCQPNNILLNI